MAVAALAGVSVVLAAAACSAAPPAPRGPANGTVNGTVNGPGPKTSATPGTATGAGGASSAATIPGCHVGAWAEDFTGAGRLAWTAGLPDTPGLADAQPVSPAVIGGLTVFADGNVLSGLRLRDGFSVWHRELGTHKNPGPGIVDGLWTWRGSVIAALATGSSAPELVSLDPATGTVRWRARLATEGLEDPPVVTSDAVLAVLTQTGTLSAFDLATGRQLWSTRYAKAGLLAAGSVVIGDAGHGSTITSRTRALTAFSGRTGKAVWSASGLPGGSQFVPAPGGRLLMYDVPEPLPPGTRRPAPGPVTALDAATGKTLWTLGTGRPVSAVWAAPAGVVVATGLPGTVLVEDPGARLYLADLATGEVRWSAAGHTDPYATPVITAANVITIATTPATGTVIDHDARTGATVWKAVISDTYGRYLAQPDGPSVLVAFPPGGSPTGSATAAGKPSVLLAIDVATGATRATRPLPYTATVGTPLTVAGADALAEPATFSCAVPVNPGNAPTAGHPGAGNPGASSTAGGVLG
jgi:outer membrane protein assembly factor BamB